MTIRELIGILLESPFYLERNLSERTELIGRCRTEGIVKTSYQEIKTLTTGVFCDIKK